MPNLVCIFWVPGSAGDMIQHLLLATDRYANQVETILDENGRAVPSIDPVLNSTFPTPANVSWHNRVWSIRDLELLKEISISAEKPYIIGTHKRDQYDLITSSIPGSLGIGITYNKNLYPAVIKNWCKKASESSLEMNEIYSRSHPVFSQRLKEKGLYAEFMLTEILKHIDNIPTSVLPTFNINIDLGDIFNADISSLLLLLTDRSVDYFNNWYKLQDPLYKLKFECNQDYINALGYNSKAIAQCDIDIELSSLDHLLILHYCKTNNWPLPQKKLRTHTQATIFFNTQQAS